MKILLHQVLSNDDFKFGYNAATGQYEDLMAAGIIDPTKVCGSVVLLFLFALISNGWLIVPLQASILPPNLFP
jgi:hypothetical protein